MSDFGIAIKYVLGWEDPGLTGAVTTDAGGRTRFGIAERYNVVPTGFYTCPAAQALAIAQGIYEVHYWQPYAWGSLQDQGLATILLDATVNPGPDFAPKALQNAINLFLVDPLVVDGWIGPLSLSAANSLDGTLLAGAVQASRAAFYHAHSAPKYMKGLLKRASCLSASNH